MKKSVLLLSMASLFSIQQLHATPLQENLFFPKTNSNYPTLQQNSDDDLQNILDNYMKNDSQITHVSGVPLTVQCPAYNNGEPITLASGKISNNGSPLPKNAIFQIGSNSKSFVSVVMLQLEAEGLLGQKGLDSIVGDYFSEYPKWKNITIKQLLNMTSGIRDYVNDDKDIWQKYNSNPYNLKPYHQINTEDILNSEKDNDLNFPTGTSWHYSNTDYVLAAKIIETVTGDTIENEIRNRILIPLHLWHTHYITDLPQWSIPSSQWHLLMSSYFYENNSELTAPYFNAGQDLRNYSMSIYNAAGSIISDTNDLNTYARALFEPGKLLTAEQINNELLALVSSNVFSSNPPPDATQLGQSINQVDSKNKEGYGLGIIAEFDSSSGYTYYQHLGATASSGTGWGYTYASGKKISFVDAFNTSGANNGQDIVQPVVNFMLKNCSSK